MTNHADWAARLDDDQAVLITGAAGFIGFFLAEKLLRAGLRVVGIDTPVKPVRRRGISIRVELPGCIERLDDAGHPKRVAPTVHIGIA